MRKPPPSLDDTGPSAPPRLAAAASLRKAVTQHVKRIPLPRWFRQPSCCRSTEQQRADLRSSRTRACARLTARLSIGGRAVRSARPTTCVFIPPTIRQNPPEAPNLQATELRQDKRRKVRPGRRPEERPNISALPRCAVLSPKVRIRESRANAGLLAHRADCQSHDRNVSRSRALLGHSRCRCAGSQWPHRKAPRLAGWSA
jgi:hypothetical protein